VDLKLSEFIVQDLLLRSTCTKQCVVKTVVITLIVSFKSCQRAVH